MSSGDLELREAFRVADARLAAPDWGDVLARAERARRRRSLILLAIAAAVLTAGIGSALAVAGGLGLLGGTPVRLTPVDRWILSGVDGSDVYGVRRIATRVGVSFYVARRADGSTCYGIGPARPLTPAQVQLGYRFEAFSCVYHSFAEPQFPSRSVPILDFSRYRPPTMRELRPPRRPMELARVIGFAADPVTKVAVTGSKNQILYSLPVRGNVYSGRPPSGGRGIVAFGRRGKVLACLAPDGCGKYTPPLASSASGSTLQPSPFPGSPAASAARQWRSVEDASVTVDGTDVTVRIRSLSRLDRWRLRSGDHEITVTCVRLVDYGGRWIASASGTKALLARTIRVAINGQWVVPPFDGCSVSGRAQPRWSSLGGTHDPLEFAFTRRGRRYFADRAVARDLTTLATDERLHGVRYSAAMPSASTVAASLGSRVVALRDATATPPLGKIGVWTNRRRRLVLVERSATGRRLYVDYRNGVIWRTDLAGLPVTF